MYVENDRVRHPKKPEWGIGEILQNSDNVLTIWFEAVGEKKLSMDYVKPVKLSPTESVSNILDGEPWKSSKEISAKGKPLCKNCGQPTQFGENADRRRFDLGWCDPCHKHSLRTFVDKDTKEVHYYDELRTTDGIKSNWSPK
jgi:hypothetical protein